MMPLDVLVGVTGGIAAYKTAGIVSRLVQSGWQVSVIMTDSAKRFAGEATFSALTGRPVCTEIFDERQFPLGAHITLAENAKLLCIAPASANFLAKAAHGIADDLLSTLFLSFTGPVMMAPAMNCDMWEKPAVARNVKQLRSDGVQMLDPEEGWLSCRKKGIGRMADPEKIFAAIQAVLEL